MIIVQLLELNINVNIVGFLRFREFKNGTIFIGGERTLYLCDGLHEIREWDRIFFINYYGT